MEKDFWEAVQFCGQDPDVSDDELDIYGEPRGEVMKSYGITSANVMKAKKRSKDGTQFY